VYNKVHKLHAAPAEYRVFPALPPAAGIAEPEHGRDHPAADPKAICAWGYIAGEPAWDPDFNCADLFILMPDRA